MKLSSRPAGPRFQAVDVRMDETCVAVSVGFAAHLVDLLDWFGWRPNPRWISPAYLPSGMTDLAGAAVYGRGWHFGFNFPAFLVVLLLTMVLVRGIRDYRRDRLGKPIDPDEWTQAALVA